MVKCWAPDCKHYNIRERCRFFSFPKEPKKRNKWIRLLRRNGTPGPGAYVCSCHFRDGIKANCPEIFAHNEAKRALFQIPPPEIRTRTPKMVMCWAFECRHYNAREKCRFFRFPKDPALRKTWMSLVRRDEEPGTGCYLCSCHFPNGKKENLPLLALHDERKFYPNFPADDHSYYALEPSALEPAGQNPTQKDDYGKMVMCRVLNCKHYNQTDSCSFFKFPKDPKLRRKWKQLLKHNVEPGRGDFLCSCHFPDGKKEKMPLLIKFCKEKHQRLKSKTRTDARTCTITSGGSE
ncbi:uncharacterized protein LOC109536585 isoform X1 [Dendroctonus ponderosae]|uniref:THAP-type domain-containing protein n=1 Tax=Dendroctonus ponderosae TaxID=77166 RepID=A0AAR5PBI0_DENPD|nr:uncharacterized protein LOC109536585 isoform X1 [Dendroctonus ponderosae]XP_019758421.1 uncharacterized protein LOC109536585 isoform X1 [Dendroctonus ponderosae]